MKKKEIQKKKQGGRGKSKPIVNIKKQSLKNKQSIVKELKEELPKSTEKVMGAPIKMTADTLQTLRLCFSVGMTDEEACYFSKISVSSLYGYQKKDKDFLKEKKILKDSITMQAKVNIGKSIKVGNVQDSKWWLEKKDSSFINKMQVGGELKIEMTEAQKKKEEKLLNKLKGFIGI